MPTLFSSDAAQKAYNAATGTVLLSPLFLWLILYLCRAGSLRRARSLLPHDLPAEVASTADGWRRRTTWAGCCLVATCVVLAICELLLWDWPFAGSSDVCVYKQMFCEPTRHGRLVRHPINAYSNLPYLYVALWLLLGSSSTAARPMDGCFAVALLVLSGVSFAWHATNVPAIQCWDLAAMQSVILFFPVRYAAVALGRWLSRRQASAFGLVGYALVVGAQVWRAAELSTGLLDTGFPTGRSRTSLSLAEALLLVAMPLVYAVAPLVAMAARGLVGDAQCLVGCFLSLAIGWQFHLAERWALDMACPQSDQRRAPPQTALRGLLQPTGTFHALTAATIMLGCLHVASLEEGASVKASGGRSRGKVE